MLEVSNDNYDYDYYYNNYDTNSVCYGVRCVTVTWIQRHSVLYDADKCDVYQSNLTRNDDNYENINNNAGNNSSNKNKKTATTKTTSSSNKNIKLKCTSKGKAIPLQAWTGPEGSRRFRLPDFKTIGT
jgi:hypothetical protein